ncbi:hypothetical protein [Acidianus manzaensis]|uniref:hypothetical protein n=1 Tax=Acidianus manzaensis TaxID=282676 RepID=UPI0026936346
MNTITLAQLILEIPINQLPLPKSTTYYYINKLKIKKRRKERTTTQTVTCPKCKSHNVIKNGSSRGKRNTNANLATLHSTKERTLD